MWLSQRSPRTSSTTLSAAMSFPFSSFTAARVWASGSCRSALPPSRFLLCLGSSPRRWRFCTLVVCATVCKCWHSLLHECLKSSSCSELFWHRSASVRYNCRITDAVVLMCSMHPQFPLWLCTWAAAPRHVYNFAQHMDMLGRFLFAVPYLSRVVLVCFCVVKI
jgi:hypothetical protein